MLLFLLESAARSLALGVVVWIALRLFRIRTPQGRSLAWTAVLLSSITMPLLMKVMASAPPSSVAWIPAVTTPSFLPPSRLFAPALSPSPAPFIDWLMVASAIYLLVAGAFLLRLLAGLLRGWQLLRMAKPLKELWASGWDVRVSGSLAIPVTYGSTILFPADWAEWSAFKRDAVFLHEISHVRRRDFLVHLMADLHRAVLWFNPMAWWLRKELLDLAEAACDDEAIRKLEDRVSYAEILVEFAGKGSVSGLMGVPMASGRTVEQRVERMLQGHTIASRTSLLRRIGLIAGLVPLVAMAAGTWNVRAATTPIALPVMKVPPVVITAPQGIPPQAPPPVAAPATTPAQESPQIKSTNYLAKWPEEEVPYIITADEQSAFQKLGTDDEREMFIEMFWMRRDRTPGTVENEVRSEYYRRIALANQRYGAGIPGWRTDRGRILILHGQPDEIETHAQGSTYIRDIRGGVGRTVTFAFERWRYRSIEGVGNNVILEFVDISRDGNYRLTFDPSERDAILTVPGQR
jgi:GWxTD domain-containing protein